MMSCRKMSKRVQRSRHQRSRSSLKRKTKHHNQAKSRGGSMAFRNIFILTEEHHRAFHLLFGNRTFKEAADVLLRLNELHECASKGGRN